jgi:hypothetical protein
MKGSAVTPEAQSEPSDSPFQRFAKVMRALVAVPKKELEEKLAQERSRDALEKVDLATPRSD